LKLEPGKGEDGLKIAYESTKDDTHVETATVDSIASCRSTLVSAHLRVYSCLKLQALRIETTSADS